MICRHCDKEYSDEFAYCPYCAEPKPEPEKSLEEEYIEKVDNEYSRWNAATIIGNILLCVFCTVILGPVGFLFGVVNFIAMLIHGKRKNVKAKKPGRQLIINAQFSNDQTSICPQCGSHSIKIYRKGYNYSVGFWGTLFGAKGSGYAGGFDANTACCRCMNCGNDWETDYDYRLIKK